MFVAILSPHLNQSKTITCAAAVGNFHFDREMRLRAELGREPVDQLRLEKVLHFGHLKNLIILEIWIIDGLSGIRQQRRYYENHARNSCGTRK